MTRIKIEEVRGKLNEHLISELSALWNQPDGLTNPETAKKRAEEAFAVARDVTGKLIGVTTVYEDLDPHLGQKMSYIRAFSDPKHRLTQGVAADLVHFVFDKMNAEYDPADNSASKGLVTVVENQYLKKKHNQAYLPDYKLCFYAYVGNDDICRVFYFDGAKIS